MGQPDLISTGTGVGLARGFSVVALRAGTALVGKTSPLRAVVASCSPDGPEGVTTDVSEETEGGVVGVVDLEGDGVKR